MNARITVDLRALGLITLKLTEAQQVQLLMALAGRIRDEIRMNTDAGKDANGAAFKPYDPKYAKWKAKLGKGRSVGSKGDWLVLTGQMLKSLTTDEVTPFFISLACLGNRTRRTWQLAKKERKKLRAARKHARQAGEFGMEVDAGTYKGKQSRAEPTNDQVASYVNLIREFLGVRPDFLDVLAELAATMIKQWQDESGGGGFGGIL